MRVHSPGWPRFAIAALHRNISLLALALVAVHVLTAVTDGYVDISLPDAVIPFGSTYRPFWTGLGAIALDLLAVLVITSLGRRHLAFGTWKALHRAAYACWPVAFVHAIGIGTDTRLGWAVALLVTCAGAVGGGVAWRFGAPAAGSA
jgi:predicted ferric reductase